MRRRVSAIAVTGDQDTAVEQRLGHRAAVAAGQVVVAGPGPAQRRRAGALAQRPDRQRRRERGQCLDHGRHLVRGQVVVAVPPGHLDLDQPGPGQLRQLGAGGGRAHPGLVREHARGQGTAVDQGAQDRCPGPVGEQPRHRGDVDVAAHLDVRLGRAPCPQCRPGTVPLAWKRSPLRALGRPAQRVADQVGERVHALEVLALGHQPSRAPGCAGP